jgi:hypothetical protein
LRKGDFIGDGIDIRKGSKKMGKILGRYVGQRDWEIINVEMPVYASHHLIIIISQSPRMVLVVVMIIS